MRKFSFQIRSAQLDLARQIETIDFIKSFIDFIHENGYNTLLLYLEGRIKTASFPFLPMEESYTPEQMKDVIRYAATKGIDVIPAIASLGHAEIFLRQRELETLAENREGAIGRFGTDAKHVFCPSLPETRLFLEKYFSEICEIFQSPYFHVGGDEAWDIGCCELCKERLRHGETQSDIYLTHLITIYCIVSGKLGKRMIVWDDMFEYYPEALEQLPRDIVMACWQYQANVEKTKGHFANYVVADSLGLYDKLGFDYLICPADYTIHNAESFTEYGAKHKPLGGLMTAWEKSESFMLQSMPAIAYVGHLWVSGVAGGYDQIFKVAVNGIFGICEEPFVEALKSVCRCGLYLERRTELDAFLTRRENDSDFKMIRPFEMLLTIFPAYLEKVKESSRDILLEIILSLRSEQISHDFDKILPEFFKNEADIPELTGELDAAISRLETLGKDRAAMWHRVRPGIFPCKIENIYADYIRNMRNVPAHAAEHGFLKVYFMLPDQYSAQTTRISIKYSEDVAWEEIGKGVFKEIMSFDCFYSRMFLIAKNKTPISLKIESWGFGGQGFTYFETENANGRFVPCRICNVSGCVSDPENMLCHDWRWAFAGERNTLKALLEYGLSNAVHRFEVELKKDQ